MQQANITRVAVVYRRINHTIYVLLHFYSICHPHYGSGGKTSNNTKKETGKFQQQYNITTVPIDLRRFTERKGQSQLPTTYRDISTSCDVITRLTVTISTADHCDDDEIDKEMAYDYLRYSVTLLFATADPIIQTHLKELLDSTLLILY